MDFERRRMQSSLTCDFFFTALKYNITAFPATQQQTRATHGFRKCLSFISTMPAMIRVVLPLQRIVIAEGSCVSMCVFLCVSVHMLWSLLHDSVISDLSLSRPVDAVQAEMSCPSLVYVWLRRKASTSDSLKPPHTHTLHITNASFSWAYWEYHGFAGCRLHCCQTACELCGSFSSSFGDTSLLATAFTFGSSTIMAWQLVESFQTELQRAAERLKPTEESVWF